MLFCILYCIYQVEVNREKGFISVFNNGRGIPVQKHKEHGIYVPELIFGHLLTGSNFDVYIPYLVFPFLHFVLF